MNRYDPYPENKDEDTKEKEILDSESTYYDYWKRKLLPQVIMKIISFCVEVLSPSNLFKAINDNAYFNCTARAKA